MGECYDRFKMGVLMGSTVGTCLGIIFGTVSALSGRGAATGANSRGFLRQVGKSVFQSGASFGFFMGIGSLVRCDSNNAYGNRR